MSPPPARLSVPLVSWFFFSLAVSGLIILLTDLIGLGGISPFSPAVVDPMGLFLTSIFLTLVGLFFVLIQAGSASAS